MPLWRNNRGPAQCVLSSIIINQSLDNHFGIEGKNYGLTSIRKVWETAKAKDESIKNLCARAHTSQSGHSEATARKFYEKPPDVMEYRDLLNMYHDALEGDRETQNHDATVVPVSNPVAILGCGVLFRAHSRFNIFVLRFV